MYGSVYNNVYVYIYIYRQTVCMIYLYVYIINTLSFKSKLTVFYEHLLKCSSLAYI